jgi:hypothetical protein
MKRVLLTILKRLLGLFIVGIFVALGYFSVMKEMEVPSHDEITALTNVSKETSLRKAGIISRQSAVKIMSLDPQTLSISGASGTYITLDNRYFILTVAHGLNPDCAFVRVVPDVSDGYEDYIDCQKMIEVNVFSDYAIIEVEKINDLSPISLLTHVPKNTDWKKSFASLSNLVYTGYPNDIGPLTIQGQVMGYSTEDHVFMHSYGWAGASGSGVFNEEGQLVGHVMAILMGETVHGINVLEDVVVVIPLFKVDWSVVFHR